MPPVWRLRAAGGGLSARPGPRPRSRAPPRRGSGGGRTWRRTPAEGGGRRPRGGRRRRSAAGRSPPARRRGRGSARPPGRRRTRPSRRAGATTAARPGTACRRCGAGPAASRSAPGPRRTSRGRRPWRPPPGRARPRTRSGAAVPSCRGTASLGGLRPPRAPGGAAPRVEHRVGCGCGHLSGPAVRRAAPGAPGGVAPRVEHRVGCGWPPQRPRSSSSTRSGRASTGTSSGSVSVGRSRRPAGTASPAAMRSSSVNAPGVGSSGPSCATGTPSTVTVMRSPAAARRTTAARSARSSRIPSLSIPHVYTGAHTPGGAARGGDLPSVAHVTGTWRAHVNFAFSEEQDELRRITRAFLESKSSEAEVRRLMETTEGYDPKVWSQMANELGLQSLAIPEEYGGQGFTNVELTVVLEEMGRALLCAPYFSTAVLAANAILHSGDEDAKKRLLPGIASGETIATLAFTEPNCRWDEAGIEATASQGDGGWTIDGTKMFVLDGHVADLIIVAARTGAGLSLFSVPGDAAGLTRTPLSTMDQTRKQAKLEFAGAPATLIGTDGAGWTTLDRVLDLAAVALAAEQVGGAQFVLEMAVQYAKDRVQFGRPIGSFQAIKHKCADMLLEVESAKSAAYYAAWCAAELNDELPEVACLAKAYCSEAYFHSAAENIQIHGGIGFTWEHPAHLYFKRAKSSELLFGDPTYHRELLAQRLGI